jgi:hypothetical protein
MGTPTPRAQLQRLIYRHFTETGEVPEHLLFTLCVVK